MALAQCALSSHFPPSSNNSIVTLKPQSSLSFPPPSKPTKRKNYLRPKLLKTLTKPLPTTPPNPLPDTPREQDPNIDSAQSLEKFPEILEINEENKLGLQEVQVQLPETSEGESGIITTWSVTQLVLYLVGLFVLQTVVTVWVWSREKGGESELEMANDEKKEGFWFSRSGEVEEESVVYVDESELEEKIMEIRAMARKVRESEANKLSEEAANVVGVDEGVSVAETMDVKANTDIQKEVDGKLSKLEKRLRADKPVGPIISFLNNSNEVNNKKELEVSGAKVSDENIVLEDKLKFENKRFELKDDPKEYQSDENDNVINGNSKVTAFVNKTNGIDVPNGGSHGSVLEEERTSISVDNSLEKTMLELEGKEEGKDTSGKGFGSTQNIARKSQKDRKSLKKGESMKSGKIKPRSGIGRESSRGLVEPGNSSKPKTRSSPTPTGSFESKQVVNNSKDKRANTKNNMWWLNLPYALAILLRRTSEIEGPGGLYSLKLGDDDSQSHIIAFEDHRDASNFCHILDAFFAELGDLTTDVVPLSIEELKDEVEASTMNVIVVRKGQLQLYAGQPLADVEMTIRSLME